MKAEGYLSAKKGNAELQSMATAVGVHNAMSKKKAKLFSEGEGEEPKKISKKEKNAQLEYFEKEF